MKRAHSTSNECPCGSMLSYASCCSRWHQGELPTTAEALMRSRYTAYVLKLEPYLLSTWHTTTCPNSLDLNAAPTQKWLRLKVIQNKTIDATNATVEFMAFYTINGRAERLHEVSRFVKEQGQWVYLNADSLVNS